MEEILASIRRIISEEGGGDRDSKTAPPTAEPAAESDDDILDLTAWFAGGGVVGAEPAPTAEDELEIEAESEAAAATGPAELAAQRTPFVVEPDTGPELEAEVELETETELEAEGDMVFEAEAPATPMAAPEPPAAPMAEPEPEPEPVSLKGPALVEPAPEETAISEPMPDDGAPTLEESIELPPEPAPALEPEPEAEPVAAAAPPPPPMSMDQVIQRAAESAVAASGALATVAPPSPGISAPAGDHSLGFGVTEQHIETAVREVLKPRLRDWLDKNLAHLVERLVREEIQRLVEQSERPK